MNAIRGLMRGASICFFVCTLTEQPIYVTVNTTQANQNHSLSQATAISYVFTKQFIVEYYEMLKNTAQTWWGMAQHHICQNKLKYASYSLIGTYAIIIWYIQSINSFINDPQCWHNWTPVFSKNELYTTEHRALAEKLKMAIKKKYFNPLDPTNAIAAVIAFFVDVADEKKRLTYYSTIIKIAIALKIGRLPFVTLPDLNVIKDAMQHILFLEQLAIAWCLEQEN